MRLSRELVVVDLPVGIACSRSPRWQDKAMTDKIMITSLRRRTIGDMTIRNLSPSTKRIYLYRWRGSVASTDDRPAN